MALRFRTSVKLFPGVRLNFSGGGISTTIGVRGASINLGKRGAHLNVGIPGSGLSYRTRLLPTQDVPVPPPTPRVAPLQPVRPAPALEVSPPPIEGEIRSADVSALTSPGLEEFKRLINDATSRRAALSNSVSKRGRELIETERRLRNAQRFLIRLFSRKRILRFTEAARAQKLNLEDAQADLAACSINVDFALDQATLDAFAAMVRVFEELRCSAVIWDITSAVDTKRAKDRTLASETVTRTSVKLALASSEIIDSAYPALRFPNANGDDIYIYPGFVMTQSKGSDFALVDVRELEVTIRTTRFVEEEPVPADSEVVGQTWKKTNKDGSPDKRFSDNYTIPITKYGQLWFSSPTGLSEAYMFSNFAKAESFAIAFENYQGRLQELARRTSHTPVLDIPPLADVPTENEPLESDVTPTIAAVPRGVFLDWIVIVVIGFAIGFGAFWAIPFFSSKEQTKVAISSEAIVPAPPANKPVIKEPSPIVPRAQPKTQKSASEPVDGARPLNLSPPTVSPREIIFVQRTNVNLRSSPSPSAAIVSVASKGTRFTVFGRDGEWVQVGESAPAGWILNTLLGPAPP